MENSLDPWLLKHVREQISDREENITAEKIANIVKLSGRILGVSDMLQLVNLIKAEMTGMSILQPLLEQPNISDILVNGTGDIWIDKGYGLEKVPYSIVKIVSDKQLRELANRLISLGGRRIDDNIPCANVNLAKGIRVHAVLPPISKQGVLLSIRIPQKNKFSLNELASNDTITAVALPIIKAIIQGRLNFLVSGATSSGKTTFLNTILGEVSHSERIITIEDVTELYPKHPHVISLESRSSNIEGKGEISLQNLLEEALRMRPDRIVVGECRGAEIRELFNALNTGHSGGCGTIHANTAQDVLSRIEALGALAGMSQTVVQNQAHSALDCILHFSRKNGKRHLEEIALVDKNKENQQLQILPIWTKYPHIDTSQGKQKLSSKLSLRGIYI